MNMYRLCTGMQPRARRIFPGIPLNRGPLALNGVKRFKLKIEIPQIETGRPTVTAITRPSNIMFG